MMYSTITEIRNQFWSQHESFKHLRRSRKRQNDYPTTIRVAFCDFVEAERRAGNITESLAQRVTL